nr:hypothetical protein HmN_000095500 [Hymenolepis microstoma]
MPYYPKKKSIKKAGRCSKCDMKPRYHLTIKPIPKVKANCSLSSANYFGCPYVTIRLRAAICRIPTLNSGLRQVDMKLLVNLVLPWLKQRSPCAFEHSGIGGRDVNRTGEQMRSRLQRPLIQTAINSHCMVNAAEIAHND